MIPPIIWARSGLDEPSSPFIRGKTERPLRITFHTSSFTDASPEDLYAIEILRQFCSFHEIEALDTEAGSLPYLEIGTFNPAGNHIPVTVSNRNAICGIIGPTSQWPRIAAQLTGQNVPTHPEAQAMLTDLLLAQAHCTLHHDILITLSPRLLNNRSKSSICEANPRSPTEAVQIVGLFLRFRENYAGQMQNAAFNRWLFYWVLARYRLPKMWRYFSACVEAESIWRDHTLSLGQSILVRCHRAIEARDAIGMQFYIAQSDSVREAILYHFDYLTILLAGAFDAQAMVARRSYAIKRPDKRYTSFGNPVFMKALRDKGATQLYLLTQEQRFKDIRTLLHELRNTIHAASFPPSPRLSKEGKEIFFLEVLPEYCSKLSAAAQRCGGLEKWGLIRDSDGLWLEPYSYGITLVTECLDLINAIAERTDITGLFPHGHDISALQDRPPNNEVFNETVGKCVLVLG